MKTTNEKSLEKRTEQEVQRDRDEATYVPLTDIYEKEDSLVLRCDLPGVAEEDVEIELENNQLSISGKQSMVDLEGFDRMLGEYGIGVFRRSFKLSQDIDQDKIVARVRNGVLELDLPKAETAKPKKIEVKAG